MAKKKLYDEEGNVVKGAKLKKPFYQRWWFIALVVIIVIGAFAGGGDEEAGTVTEPDNVELVDEVDADDNVEAENDEIEQDSDGILSFGESATIDDITFTVKSASFTDERNQFADTEPEQVIKIDFTLENGGDQDYPVGIDTQVYVDGTQATSYPLGSDIGSVSAGRTFEGSVYYGVNGNVVELEWEPFMSFTGDKAIWNVTP